MIIRILSYVMDLVTPAALFFDVEVIGTFLYFPGLQCLDFALSVTNIYNYKFYGVPVMYDMFF